MTTLKNFGDNDLKIGELAERIVAMLAEEKVDTWVAEQSLNAAKVLLRALPVVAVTGQDLQRDAMDIFHRSWKYR